MFYYLNNTYHFIKIFYKFWRKCFLITTCIVYSAASLTLFCKGNTCLSYVNFVIEKILLIPLHWYHCNALIKYDITVVVWGLPNFTIGSSLFHIGMFIFQVLRGHSTSVQTVAFSPSGKHIASASICGEIKLWSALNASQVNYFIRCYINVI